MDKIDPNHDLVPTLRMMDGLLFDRAADEIEKWRDAYRKAVQTPAAELMVVGPGWHERFPVITAPIVIDGLLQVHVSDRRDDMADELTRLRAEVASLTAQLQSGESFHAVAVRQRDAAWGEVETLKATLTQQCKGFRADVEKLEAEVEALRASAERWIYINERNGEWRRFEADGPDPAYSMLCVRLPYDADLSCRATREIAIDAARAAREGRG